MAELVLRNKGIISKLEYIRSEVFKTEIITNEDKYRDKLTRNPQEDLADPEKFMSKEHLFKHMSDPNHEGFPVEHCSLPVEVMSRSDNKLAHIVNYTRNEFISDLGANSDAVFLYYPPRGFVGWHTNQNNSGHQFIFSWSERGDGYFQYYDKQKKEIIKIPDKSGWQARHYHFGEDVADHCWHSAYTNVPRITVCVLFRWWDKPHMKEQVLAMKDQLIEEIESED